MHCAGVLRYFHTRPRSTVSEMNLPMDLPAAWRHYVSPCSHENGMDLCQLPRFGRCRPAVRHQVHAARHTHMSHDLNLSEFRCRNSECTMVGSLTGHATAPSAKPREPCAYVVCCRQASHMHELTCSSRKFKCGRLAAPFCIMIWVHVVRSRTEGSSPCSCMPAHACGGQAAYASSIHP